MNLALDPAVARKLDAYRRRRTRLTAFRALCAGVTALLIGMAAVALIDWYWLLTDSTRWLLSLGAYAGAALAAIGACVGRFGRLSRREEIAAAIEDADPAMRERLLSAVELAADDPASVHDSPAFRALLQGDVARRMANVRPAKLLPLRLVAGWAAAAAVVMLLTAAAAATGGSRVRHLLHRAALPGANLARVSRVNVEILDPSPASLTLPAGDTVAVRVAVTGDGFLDGGVNEVILETAPVDGEDGDADAKALPMRPAPDAEDEWTVNLPLGEEDLTYRVLAGDAITKRYTLSVRPRPRIVAFGKTIALPEYAGLPPQTVSEPHGDLFALEGSSVTLTLEPNQPVVEAELHRTPADPDAAIEVLPLSPNDGPDGVTRWTTTLPIEEPSTYRVHLVAEETGFDNPFAPRSEIRPLTDLPPTVAFTQRPEQVPAGLLLPPDDLLDLAGAAEDDLPLDRLERLVSINGGEWTATELAFETAAEGRDLSATWRWDLLPLDLKTGDEVRTKLSATDRKGQTGESGTLRVLIAEDDFDPLRHAAAERKLALLEEFDAFAAAVAEQNTRAEAALERLKQIGADPPTDGEPSDETAAARAEEYGVLRDLRGRRRDAAATLVAKLAALLPEQPAGADALELDLAGQYVSRIGLSPTLDPVAAQAAGMPEFQIRDALRRDFSSAEQEAERMARWMRRFATHGYLAALAADLDAVQRQQERLADTPGISWERLARQETVAVGRMEEIGQFVRRHQERLTQNVGRDVDRLLERLGEMQSRLEVAAAAGAGDRGPRGDDLRRFRAAAASVRDELRGHVPTRQLNELASDLRATWKELWNRTGDAPDRLANAVEAIERLERLAAKRADADDSQEADELRALFAQAALDPEGDLAAPIARFRDVRTLQKARSDADTVFAADSGLAARALSAVADAVVTDAPPADETNADDATPALPDGVTASFALTEIAPAIRTLQAAHELSAARRLAATLRDRERWDAQSAAGRFDHPRQWDAYQTQLDQALDGLRRAKAMTEAPELEQTLNEMRWSEPTKRASALLSDRRFKNAGPIAADAELAELAAGLRTVERDLAPTFAEARAVLEKYAPTISELARAAAEAAREREEAAEKVASAADKADADPAETSEAIRELNREQAAAERDLAELTEALVDDADRQDLADTQQRDRAKDADAAIAAVQTPAEAAERALAEAARARAPEEQVEPLDDAAESQSETAEALDLVAEHFERMDAGEDPTETREALREAAAEAGAMQELEERFAPSEALAEAAAGNLDDLLAELEAELAENPAMQEALSEIAADAAADAKNALEEAVEQERSIQADLDRSDQDFQAKKEAVAEALRELAEETERLANRAAETARRAADRGQADEAEAALDEAREALNEARDATRNAAENDPLPRLAAAAKQADEALNKAAEALKRAREQAAAEADEEVHRNDGDRNRGQQVSERERQQLRRAQEQDARMEQQQAERARRDAESALQRAERAARDAENQAQQAKRDAERDADDAGKAERAAQAEDRAAQKKADKEAAEQARDAARAAEEQARKDAEAVRRQPNPPLKKANPAAQLAEQLAGEAEKEAEALQKKAAEIAANADFDAELEASESALARSEARQEDVTERVAAAAADLERAARHEERLGQPANAEPLAAAAKEIAELAEGESTTAQEKLAAAQPAPAEGDAAEGEPAEGDPEAGEPAPVDPNADVEARNAVAEAEAALAQGAEALAQSLAEAGEPGEAADATAGDPQAGDPQAGAPQPGDPQAGSPQQAGSPPPAGAPPAGQPQGRRSAEDQARGQELARQLDAVDRALNAPPQSATGEPGEPGAPGSEDAAAELFAAAAAAQSAAVSAARAAQNAPPAPGMPMPGQPGQPGEPGEPGEPGLAAAEGMGVATGEGGAGVEGGPATAAAAADWANLRRRDAEDVSAGRSAAVSEEYRDSVNAYFRVLAERARQGDRQGDR